MHNPAPPTQEPTPLACLVPSSVEQRSRRAGFSLIEVTLAIAIVAFAFVALIGLLPAGLGVFNQTMDSTNEMRISSYMTSMIQASNYDGLTDAYAQNVYYFDVDGGMLDSKLDERDQYKEDRIYSAKVVFDKQTIEPTALEFSQPTEGKKVMILIGRYTEAVNTKLESLTSGEEVKAMMNDPKKGVKIRVFPMLISKTDGKTP